MTCAHCNGTGSLSKDAYGYLDCAYCDVAQERADFEADAPEQPTVVDLWLAYQRGKAGGRPSA
ncbi:hypothetical protein INH39_25420 [Massilia violaceinigra]|uniref:Zinc ribbon domain-containing protein n=1 Tax=Massilia violaceinigra TaxID=2045208 RepID=A0ABY4A5C0_9BURK|nr:hypothetical protein [Massilia violaceinigra]UOD28751.1 hypothetical protein INH39_25420 [Massilia violaceinigra]